MLLGSGSIRLPCLGPIVEYGGLAETFPYHDGVYMLKITGVQFRRMMSYMLRDEAFLGTTEFYQLSGGVRLTYSRSRHRIEQLTFNGKEIEDDRILTVGLQNYHFSNLKDFLDLSYDEASEIQTPRVVSTSCLDILEEYLSSHSLIESNVEGRIVICE